MDLTILILRLVLGVLVVGHGLQKSTGWFHGTGLDLSSKVFASWGFRPGRTLVLLASACEVGGGLLVALGLLMPLACAIIIGTMAVACAPNAKAFWAARGGFELTLIYAAIAAALGFSGGGPLALDALLPSLNCMNWMLGSGSILVGLLGALPVLLMRRRNLAADASV